MPEIVSPIDGTVAFRYDTLTAAQATARLDAAEAAQRAWRSAPLSQRTAVCLAMLDAYAGHLPQFSQQITRMMGKPIGQARGEFEKTMRERVEHLCAIAPDALADQPLPKQPGLDRFIRRDPVGVVLDIAAWNYPLVIAVNVIVPAVLAGNAVLVKHASQTALVADQFEQAFREAGAPEGLVQAMPMDHGVTASLISTRRLGYVSFTGSVRGGHEVYRTVAKDNFIGVGMELGGKDAALVAVDADLDFAVENLVDGSFYNAGQSCCGIERIYVVKSVFERFVEAFVATTRGYVLGNPLEETTTLGPLVDAKAAAYVRDQVAQAKQAGARIVVGDADFAVPDASNCYLAPHVLIDVEQSMAVMREETFGPAIGIMAVADEDEGIARMNDSDYGLTASIWTTDPERGRALAQRAEAGTVYQNRCDYLDPGLAWTGVKDSGFGCSLSTYGFLPVTRPKSYHLRTAT